jgi:RND family efflux transporter MFP subunit
MTNFLEEPPPPSRPSAGRKLATIVFIAIATLGVLGAGAYLLLQERSRSSTKALAAEAKAVAVACAKRSDYRETRRYVGNIEPWLVAKVGPQFVSAYVKQVMFRPGATVAEGAVVATLDCSHVSADSESARMRARAHQERQKALADEAKRLAALVKRGFVSENEVEKKLAESASEEAQFSAAKAWAVSRELEVSDCILRSPFHGEVSERMFDPGAFIRPGGAIVTVVDRGKVRVTADIPEKDFAHVAPGSHVRVHILATKKTFPARVSRRAPAADPATRTVHVEIDLVNRNRQIPVGTTAELYIDVGKPVPATEIPLTAASIHGDKASVFVVEGEVVHRKRVHIEGEHEGTLFVEPTLTPGTRVVTEGRALLRDGDRVKVAISGEPPPARAAGGKKHPRSAKKPPPDAGRREARR